MSRRTDVHRYTADTLLRGYIYVSVILHTRHRAPRFLDEYNVLVVKAHVYQCLSEPIPWISYLVIGRKEDGDIAKVDI